MRFPFNPTEEARSPSLISLNHAEPPLRPLSLGTRDACFALTRELSNHDLAARRAAFLDSLRQRRGCGLIPRSINARALVIYAGRHNYVIFIR